MPSGGEEQLQSALELAVTERLRWEVERVVGLRGVERRAEGGRVLQRRRRLVVDTGLGGVVRHGQLAVGLLAVDLLRNQGEQLRLQRIQLVQTGCDIGQLVGQGIDSVECVEDRTQRRAGRDVEAVRLPVEVVAQRPEEIIEVRDLVAQILCHSDGLVECLDLLMSGCGTLLLQGVLLPQDVDRLVDLAYLLEQVCGARLLIGQVVDLRAALSADLEGHRAVVERGGSQWARDGLDHRDAGRMEDGLGDPLQQNHVGRVPQIVVGLDHQQFGIESGLREVPLSGGVADVGRNIGGHIGTDVVTGLVAGQRQQTDQRDPQGDNKDGGRATAR